MRAYRCDRCGLYSTALITNTMQGTALLDGLVVVVSVKLEFEDRAYSPLDLCPTCQKVLASEALGDLLRSPVVEDTTS